MPAALCWFCRTAFPAHDAATARTVFCPHCRAAVRVPAPDDSDSVPVGREPRPDPARLLRVARVVLPRPDHATPLWSDPVVPGLHSSSRSFPDSDVVVLGVDPDPDDQPTGSEPRTATFAPPWAGHDRRSARRFVPRPGVSAECWAGGAGPNVVQRLIELSVAGCRLLVSPRVETGRDVTVVISPSGGTTVVRLSGQVVWALSAHGVAFTVGIEFDRPIPDGVLAVLARVK